MAKSFHLQFLAALAIALTGAGSLAANQPQLELPATSPWLLRYDDDRCRAVREFGAGDDLVTLWLDQSSNQPTYNLSIVGGPAKGRFGQAITLKFGSEPESTRSYTVGETKTDKPVLTMYGVYLAAPPGPEADDIRSLDANREAAIDRISLSGANGRRVVLLTGSMGDILAAMRKCAVDLENTLRGTESDIGGAWSQAIPQRSGEPWVTGDDFPAVLARQDQNGLVRFTLVVDASGRPTACQVNSNQETEAFKDVTCLALLKRARFKPALDKAGRPRASYYTAAVRFEVR